MGINVLSGQRILSHVKELLLSEFSVLVDINLCINTVNIVAGINSPWIDFKLGGICFVEQVVKVSDLLSVTFYVFQVQVLFKSVQELFSDSLVEFDRVNFDLLRVMFGDLFNLDTSLGRSNNCWSLTVSIQNECKVNLSYDVNSFMDQNGIYF